MTHGSLPHQGGLAVLQGILQLCQHLVVVLVISAKVNQASQTRRQLLIPRETRKSYKEGNAVIGNMVAPLAIMFIYVVYYIDNID